MGLDIRVYQNVKLYDTPPTENEEDYVSCYNDPASHEQLGDLKGKYYHFTESAVWNFRVGSYGWYNAWRQHLCKAATGLDIKSVWEADDNSVKFGHLLNFSDCEGVICAEVCKSLAKDFEEFEYLFMASTSNEQYQAVYLDFKRAFQMASENGLVKFC